MFLKVNVHGSRTKTYLFFIFSAGRGRGGGCGSPPFNPIYVTKKYKWQGWIYEVPDVLLKEELFVLDSSCPLSTDWEMEHWSNFGRHVLRMVEVPDI